MWQIRFADCCGVITDSIVVKDNATGLLAEVVLNEKLKAKLEYDASKECIQSVINTYNADKPKYLKVLKVIIRKEPFKRNEMNKIIRE